MPASGAIGPSLRLWSELDQTWFLKSINRKTGKWITVLCVILSTYNKRTHHSHYILSCLSYTQPSKHETISEQKFNYSKSIMHGKMPQIGSSKWCPPTSTNTHTHLCFHFRTCAISTGLVRTSSGQKTLQMQQPWILSLESSFDDEGFCINNLNNPKHEQKHYHDPKLMWR